MVTATRVCVCMCVRVCVCPIQHCHDQHDRSRAGLLLGAGHDPVCRRLLKTPVDFILFVVPAAQVCSADCGAAAGTSCLQTVTAVPAARRQQYVFVSSREQTIEYRLTDGAWRVSLCVLCCLFAVAAATSGCLANTAPVFQGSTPADGVNLCSVAGVQVLCCGGCCCAVILRDLSLDKQCC